MAGRVQPFQPTPKAKQSAALSDYEANADAVSEGCFRRYVASDEEGPTDGPTSSTSRASCLARFLTSTWRRSGAVLLVVVRQGSTADQARCLHPRLLHVSHQYGCWRKSANGHRRTSYKDKETGHQSTFTTFIVSHASAEVFLQDDVDVTTILNSGCRGSVA